MIQQCHPVTLTLCSSPPKGETTHYILRVASAPSKCVRCAPQGRYHNPRPAGPSNLRTLRPIGPVNPKNLPLKYLTNSWAEGPSILRIFSTTLLHNPRRQPRPFFKNLRQRRHHNPRPEGPSILRTLRTLGAKPRQPSHRRRVHSSLTFHGKGSIMKQ